MGDNLERDCVASIRDAIPPRGALYAHTLFGRKYRRNLRVFASIVSFARVVESLRFSRGKPGILGLGAGCEGSS